MDEPPGLAAYVVPNDPDDPQAAALELIVRLTEAVTHDSGPCETLQEVTAVLDVEDAFAGMSWRDARHVAAAICFDVCNRDDAAPFLLARAEQALDGTDNMGWDDPAKMARALTIAADLLVTTS